MSCVVLPESSELSCATLPEQVLASDFAPQAAAAVMRRLSKWAARFIGERGFSIGVDDVIPLPRLSQDVADVTAQQLRGLPGLRHLPVLLLGSICEQHCMMHGINHLPVLASDSPVAGQQALCLAASA